MTGWSAVAAAVAASEHDDTAVAAADVLDVVVAHAVHNVVVDVAGGYNSVLAV